jgi:hypothetical protein
MKLADLKLAFYVEASEHFDWVERQQENGRLARLNEQRSILIIARAIHMVDAITPFCRFFAPAHRARLVRACIVYQWFEKQ